MFICFLSRNIPLLENTEGGWGGGGQGQEFFVVVVQVFCQYLVPILPNDSPAISYRVSTRQDYVRMNLIFGNVSGLSGYSGKKAKKGVKSGYYGMCQDLYQDI